MWNIICRCTEAVWHLAKDKQKCLYYMKWAKSSVILRRLDILWNKLINLTGTLNFFSEPRYSQEGEGQRQLVVSNYWLFSWLLHFCLFNTFWSPTPDTNKTRCLRTTDAHRIFTIFETRICTTLSNCVLMWWWNNPMETLRPATMFATFKVSLVTFFVIPKLAFNFRRFS